MLPKASEPSVAKAEGRENTCHFPRANPRTSYRWREKTPEFVDAIQGHSKAINTELTRLVGIGEIVKVRRGVYRLPES